MRPADASQDSLAKRVGRLALLACALVVLVVAWRGQHDFQYGEPRARGGWVLLGATGLLVLAGALSQRVSSRHPAALPLDTGEGSRPGGSAGPRWSRNEWIGVAVLCVVGIAFRCVYFYTVPSGMNHDSAWYGMYAIHITQGAPYTPYIAAAWGRETLFMYVIAPLLWFMGNTPEAVQLASTLCGIATLVPFYVLARAMFGRRIAMLGLAFLAVSGWHGVFSRAGWRVITVPPFEILALYGAWRVLQTQFVWHWVLTGCGAALSVYTYNSGRIVPLMAAAFYLLFFPRGRQRRRSHLRGGVIALVTFLIVGGPMLWYAVNHFQEFQGRAEFLLQQREKEASLPANWIAAAGMFNYRGNGDDFFINEPLLEPMAAVLFLIGIITALWQVTRREYLFVLAGLLISLLPGVLTVPNGNRGITAVPFVYALIPIGLACFADGCAALVRPGRGRDVLFAGLVSLAIGVAAIESYQEFLGPSRRPMGGFSAAATAAGEFMHEHINTYRTYTIAGNWPEYTLIYLSYPGQGSPFERQFAYGRTLGQVEDEIDRYGTKGLLFLLDLGPEGTSALERLEKRFAEHRLEPVKARRAGGEVVAKAFFVEPEALSKSGLWGNYTRSLFIHDQPAGPPGATATRCVPAMGDADGVSIRLRLMLPEMHAPTAVGAVRLLTACPPMAEPTPLLTLGVNPEGLVVTGDHTETLLPWGQIEAGRWYEIYATISASDRGARLVIDGERLESARPLRVDQKLPVRVAGLHVLGEHVHDPGGHFYLDDVTVVSGTIEPWDERWVPAKRSAETAAVDENFEDKAFGPLAAAGGWQDIAGAVTVANSPTFWRHGGQGGGENAFDGRLGEGPGQFNEPMGVAVDPVGNFYVSERLNHRIQKFAPDGTYLTGWGKQGSAPGEFQEPMDVTAGDQFLYVADTWNHRIQVFDWDGNFVFQIQGDPTFSSPRGIFARHQRVYLADSGRGIVRVFEQSGKALLTMGQNGGSEAGHLMEPVDVVVDAEGRVYAVNSGNNRIEIFAADGASVGSFPVPGWEGRNLKEGYLGIDGAEVIYLSDPVSGRVRRFRRDGTELDPIGPKLDTPSGLALDDHRLLVAGRRNHVVKATFLGTAAAEAKR